MEIEFFMPMEKVPTSTHQEKKLAIRNGKPITYESEDARATREKLMSHLTPHKIPTDQMIIGKPICLISKWCYKRTGKHKNGEYKITKPDTDNIVKTLKDCMTELKFWKDDALVASEHIEKFWSDIPGIYVKVEEL